MNLRALAWLGIRIERFEETVGFFGDVMHLPVDKEGPKYVVFRLPDGALFINPSVGD